MHPAESISVFEVSDDRQTFLDYLTYLHEQGLRPTRDAWLKEVAGRLMGVENPDQTPPSAVDDDVWTWARRRLLVVMTWPYPSGELAPRSPFPYDPSDPEGGGASGVYGRTYRQLWADVRTNLKSLEWLARWRGDWAVLAEKWGLSEDVLSDTARLGLVVTPTGELVSASTVDALRADVHDRVALAREGFVLTWWDIVAIAECVGFWFEPVEPTEVTAGRTNGRYLWSRADLVERIGRARPLELHQRITAGGRITPPVNGSKYRALFEHLDGLDFVGKQTLSRKELDDLTSHQQAVRSIRGARGTSGLPRSALSSVQWWYGPWNPDAVGPGYTFSTAASWSDAIGKKPQTRAWMATGLRAKPVFKQGTLVAVQFEPVSGREDWWLMRDPLRSGSYSERVSQV